MTAADGLHLNGNVRDSPLMEVVRRFHALSSSRNLPFSKEIIQTYDPAARKHCLKAFETAVRASHNKKRERRDVESS